jgi:hypothetical protein
VPGGECAVRRLRNGKSAKYPAPPALSVSCPGPGKTTIKKKKKMSKSAKYSALTALLQFIYALIH